jgi:autotransporter-associated beta strand protein
VSINGLLLGAGVSVTTDVNTLTVASGAIVAASGNSTISSTSGGLSLGAGESMMNVAAGASLGISSTITGTGALSKVGSGTLSLSGDSSATFTGSIYVDRGTLSAANNGALGNTTAGTTVASGASLEVAAAGVTIPEPLTLSGTGVNSAGVLRLKDVTAGSDTSTLTGNITLLGDATMTVDGASDKLALGTDSVSYIAGLFGLVKQGAGTLELAGSRSNRYLGNTTINEGTLLLAKTGFAQAIAAGTVNVGDNTG